MTSAFRLLTTDYGPPAPLIVAAMPTIYGEKPMRIVARVMAWRIEGEKVRYCDNTATIRPSKSGHKTTPCDAHTVANRKWLFCDL